MKMNPVLIQTPNHEDVMGGVAVELQALLTSVLDGGEWSALHSGSFTPRERAPGTHWKGGWVVPRAGLDVMVKRKFPCPCRNLTLFVYPIVLLLY
jgi:hypothetical protein